MHSDLASPAVLHCCGANQVNGVGIHEKSGIGSIFVMTEDQVNHVYRAYDPTLLDLERIEALV